jgi:hypothetical protein
VPCVLALLEAEVFERLFERLLERLIFVPQAHLGRPTVFIAARKRSSCRRRGRTGTMPDSPIPDLARSPERVPPRSASRVDLSLEPDEDRGAISLTHICEREVTGWR